MPDGASFVQNRAFQCEKIVTAYAKFVTKNLGANRIKESQKWKIQLMIPSLHKTMIDVSVLSADSFPIPPASLIGGKPLIEEIESR